jgi:hypothetical protein
MSRLDIDALLPAVFQHFTHALTLLGEAEDGERERGFLEVIRLFQGQVRHLCEHGLRQRGLRAAEAKEWVGYADLHASDPRQMDPLFEALFGVSFRSLFGDSWSTIETGLNTIALHIFRRLTNGARRYPAVDLEMAGEVTLCASDLLARGALAVPAIAYDGLGKMPALPAPSAARLLTEEDRRGLHKLLKVARGRRTRSMFDSFMFGLPRYYHVSRPESHPIAPAAAAAPAAPVASPPPQKES